MLEQLFNFECVFNDLTLCTIECISWTIKYLMLLMHGTSMNILFPYLKMIESARFTLKILPNIWYPINSRGYLLC